MKKIILLASLAFSINLMAQIPTSGLISYYPFTGNADDESVNSNDGVVNGATLTTDRFGHQNSAYFFDGINDWINLGDDPSLHYNQSTSSTISIWFNSNSTSGGQDLVRYDDMDIGDGDNPNPRNLLLLRLENPDSDSDLDLRYMYGTADPFSLSNNMFFSNNQIMVGTWHHICAVKDNAKDSSYLYLDGELVYEQEDSSVGIWETTGQYLMLGKYENTVWEGFSGVMDDIRFYDVPLTETQIQALYNEIDYSAGVLETNLSQEITVFPNPTTSNVNINLGRTYSKVFINIRDVVGKTISTKSFELTENINFNMIGSPGVYFIEVSTNNGESAQLKIIKQ